jgi:dihydroorotase
MGTLLQNGWVHTDHGFVQQDVRLDDERFVEVGVGLTPRDGEELVDCTGLHVMPGFMDAHVHVRDPGLTHKEDLATGSKAAAAGGVTAFLDMPNTNPPVVSIEVLNEKRAIANEKSMVNFGFFALGCVENKTNLEQFDNIPGVKVFLASSTGNYLTDDIGDFTEIVANSPFPIAVHAENEDIIRYFSRIHADTDMHHLQRDNLAAVVSVAESTLIANYYGKRIHIVHMSTAEEVDYLRRNKTDLVTCEVCPHHLYLTEEYFRENGNYGKMNPCLRYEKDRDALWKAIEEGLVDQIATDHAPHLREEKDRPFDKAPAGVPGIELMVPLMLHAVNEGRLTLEHLVQLCASNPTKIYGIVERGQIKPGNWADLTIVDMKMEKEVRNEEQVTRCGWTPFAGMTLKGWPVMTYVNGHRVFHRGEFTTETPGQELTFDNREG